MISKTPSSERPRERCLEAGPQSLSLRECLALILGSGPPKTGCLGLAQQLLDRAGLGLPIDDLEHSFFAALEVSGKAYLSEISGLGPAGQAKILAAFDLGRRYSLYRSRHLLCLNSSGSRADSVLFSRVMRKISLRERAEPQEWLGFVPIYRSGRVGNLCIVEKGVRTHVNVDPAELFARILALRPKGIFLFHNHPSGSLAPSHEDEFLTHQVREVAENFGIHFMGHWIVSLEGQREVVSNAYPKNV